MELIERSDFLQILRKTFSDVETGEGHCLLVSGEAGIGKTSLVKTFCNEKKNDCRIYQGTCDALFTPRPLAPLYDIAWQLDKTYAQTVENDADRAAMFSILFRTLSNLKETKLVVFEDIQWADEATLDFIKFFVRRIIRVNCLFILTYRNDEINSNHLLRNVLGQLPSDSITRLQLPPFSRQTVESMANERGYRGEDVYSISGGNPFYVNEILASYSSGVPHNIKDAILSVFNGQRDQTKRVWEILSVVPTGFEIKYLELLEPDYASAISNSLESKILLLNNGLISFKHELYRRTVESSLSPLVRISLNKKILFLLLDHLSGDKRMERIIHHAKNANESELVLQYAPLAAAQAASVGAHIEASRLYYSAIEYYQGDDQDILVELYERYSYECYLTNQIKDAIIFQGKALTIWRNKNNIEKTGNCLRFLSRLWWFEGNREKAERYGSEAIEILRDQLPSSIKAMAFSNMSQLKMLSNEGVECIFWGKKAITMAKELYDEETLCHALNNVGTVYMETGSIKKGIELLEQSLGIALKNSFHEHVACAYANLASNTLRIKDFTSSKKALDAGISYTEERDLNSWTACMLADKAKLNLLTGNWNEAVNIAGGLIRFESQAPIVKIGALVVLGTIATRRGDIDSARSLINEANDMAFQMMELHRIVPALVTSLEYEWVTGQSLMEKSRLDYAIKLAGKMGCKYQNNDFRFWLLKVRNQCLSIKEIYAGYEVFDIVTARKSADVWQRFGCPYEQALTLFEGDETDKKKGIKIVHALGANAVYEKMKLEMRSSGIKSIPRGRRKTKQVNVANLTSRELDIVELLKENLQNKEIADRLFISAKTVDHHISSILLKLNVNSRTKVVGEAVKLGIIIREHF